MFSNPTGLFNLSLPDKLMRTKNYQFLSYSQFKSMQANNSEERAEEAAGEDPQEKEADINCKDWSENGVQGTVLLRLSVQNKVK